MQVFEARFEDPEEMPERMSSMAKNFSIAPMCKGPFEASVKGARLGSVALFRLSTTAARVISHNELGHLGIDLPGTSPLEVRIDGRLSIYHPGEGHLVNPDDILDLRFAGGTDELSLSVFDPLLHDYEAAFSGGTGDQPRRLPRRLRLDHPDGQALRRYVTFLWSEVQSGSPLLASDLIVEELEKALLTSLLLAADDARPPDHRTLPLAYLRRAVDFILAHLSEPQSLGGIAAAAGVHGRTLQKAFRKHYGMNVMAFVQRRRLELVHRELHASDPTTTSVTKVALARGFVHLGRFAAAYRNQFGELPSETLRWWLAPPFGGP